MRPRVGVYICECGPNISGIVDMDRIMSSLENTGDFGEVDLIVKKYGFLCSKPGKDFLEEEIRGQELTHLVVGACSPRDHNSTFMEVCSRTDLNPYLYRIVNIREHCTWVIDDKEKATERALSYLRAGIARVLHQSELFECPIDANPDVMVIGGGIAGIEAALAMAGKDRKVFIVEHEDKLGGRSSQLAGFSAGDFRQPDYIAAKVEAVLENPDVEVFLNTAVESVIGFLGNFEITLSTKDYPSREINSGAIIAANGSRTADPLTFEGFDYSESDDVYTSMEVIGMLADDGQVSLRSGGRPESIALLHCSGREQAGYCSGMCCTALMKLALLLKDRLPEVAIDELHRDMCLPPVGGNELRGSVAKAGVEMIRTCGSSISGTMVSFNAMDGSKHEKEYDMVILAPPLVPAEDSGSIAEMLKIPLDESGFFREAHRMTNPSGTTTDGIFIAGTAHGPMNIQDSMRLARAAAGQILTKLQPGEKLVPEVAVSEILEAYCTGCGNCLEVCVYGAIYSDESKGVSVVNQAICRGCGNCFGSCPSGALRTKHFTNTQLYREVDEALR